MYCKLMGKYVNDHECDICDNRAGYEIGTWRAVCQREEHHPIWPLFKWWLKPRALIFKFYIIIAWIANRFKPKRRVFVWSSSVDGWHVGHLKLNLGEWLE